MVRRSPQWAQSFVGGSWDTDAQPGDVARLEHDDWQWRHADWKRRDDARNELVRQMEEVEAADARRLVEAHAVAEQQRQAEVDAFRVIKETIARDRPSQQEIERAVERSGIALPNEY